MGATEDIVETEATLGAPPPDPAPQTVRLGARAAHGMVWMLSQTVLMKGITLVCQVALSWYLKEVDIGVSTQAFTATAFVAPVSQIGVREVLVRNSDEFEKLYSAGIWIATLFGILCSLAMWVTLPLARTFFYGAHAAQNYPQETYKLALFTFLIAISVPANGFATIPMARLQSQLRFRLISALTFGQSASLIILSVFFAWAGYGVYSLVIPWPIVAIVRLLVLLAYAGLPRTWGPNFRHWGFLLRGGTSLLGVRLCATFVGYGDYLMLGHFHNLVSLGIYSWAFNQSMQSITLLAGNVESVLFPALSSIKGDTERQRKAFLSGATSLALIGVPLCLLQAGVARPVVHLFFPSRWYPGIPIIQILSIGMAMRLLTSPSYSMLQAQGKFTKYLIISIIGAVTFMTAVTTGAILGSEVAVAIAAASYFFVEGPTLVYLSLGTGTNRAREVLRILMLPLLGGAVAVGLGVLIAFKMPSGRLGDLLSLCTRLIITMVVYWMLVNWFAPDAWRSLVQRLLPRWRQRA